MPASFEEIQSSITNPEILGKIVSDEKIFPVITEAIKGRGFHILDEKGREELLSNYLNSEKPKLIGEFTKEIHSAYDKDLKEVYGESSDLLKPRDGETKSYHVNKRIHKEQLQTIKDLQEKLAKGDHKDFYEGKIRETETKAQQAIAEKQKELESLRNVILGSQKESKFMEAFTPLLGRMEPSVLSDDLFKDASATIKDFVLSNSKMEDGQFVMVGKDGMVLKDSSFKPVTVAAYLENRYKSKFKKEDQGGAGTGGGAKPTTNPNEITVETFNPGDVKTKADLMKSIVGAGIPSQSPKFFELFAHFAQKLKLTS